ncbi:MAG: hypothetical protein J5706_01310 [Elusimicrobiales bacterium]|nr:hypothetical protein [Elusimicrobiales bacterium]
MTHKVKTYIKNTESNIYDKEYQDDLLTDAKIKQNESEHRHWLSKILVGISVSWLIFTGIVIWQYGRGCLQYDSATSVSFIIGSLAEVFALWKISLSYFFHVE